MNKTEVLSDELPVFSKWYDAIWLGDGEHGQYIPTNGDKKYSEYLEGRTLALGAWMERARVAKLAEKHEPVAWRFKNSKAHGWSNWRTDKADHDSFKALGWPIEYAYSRPPVTPALVEAADGIRLVECWSKFDGENQQHIPELHITFTPVPANAPNDALGWKQRDKLADALRAAIEAYKKGGAA